MPESAARPTGVLLPISLSHGGQKIDMAVPASLALVEILPGMIQALGRLDAESATQGYTVMSATGKALDQGRSLADQGVRAGSVLSVEVAGTSAADLRYDDLVEAIGHSVDETQRPWRRGDSVQLSTYAAAALFVMAAGLMVVQGAPSIVTAAIGVVGAILVTLAAAVVARIPSPEGAAALAHVAPVLTGAAAFCVVEGPWNGVPLLASGVGIMVGAAACAVLPASLRVSAAAPLTAGAALTLAGGLIGVAHLPADRAASLVITIVTVLTLTAPWIGLAQVPARVDALAQAPRQRIDGSAVRDQVRDGAVLVLSLKIASSIIIVALTPLVAGTPAGAALMACIGVALMLSTRSLHGRVEVLVGVLTGMAVTIVTAITAAVNDPRLLPVIVASTLVIGSLVLAANVVNARMRPWLTRLADAGGVIALLAVLPLAIGVWGLI